MIMRASPQNLIDMRFTVVAHCAVSRLRTYIDSLKDSLNTTGLSMMTLKICHDDPITSLNKSGRCFLASVYPANRDDIKPP